MQPDFFYRNRQAVIYGISLALLLLFLKWLELRFVIINHMLEVYVGGIALLFTVVGIWLARKLMRPRVETVVIEKEVAIVQSAVFAFNAAEMSKLGLSKRELEVLQHISEGLSNQQIAEKLFVSLNTVKTHSSRLFEKMDVKSRTQAVGKAKRLSLIP